LKQKWEIGFCTFLKASNNQIYYIKMKVCVCVCMCVRRPAAGPTQAITPKFGMGSSFHPGSAPSRGGDPKCWPQAPPTAHPRPAHGPPTARPRPAHGPPTARPLFLLSFLDQSARDYFTIILWNSPGQRRVAHACL
jgi:hypothetical protein